MHGKPISLAIACGPRPARRAAAIGELPEAELLERARGGDREAWGALVARHDHRVVVALLARGIRLAEARELSHQAWSRLIAQQQAGRLRQLELPGLAIRQAAFLAQDSARAERVASRRAEADGQAQLDAAELSDPAASVEDRLIRREQLQRVEAELARCSPVARQLFALLYRNPGMRHADAARALGLSVQRVRQILCEVRARLRIALDAESNHG